MWNVRHQRWWWSAWRASTGTDLWGFTDSREDALRAMSVAIRRTDSQQGPPGQRMQF